MKTSKIILTCALSSLLTACSGFFDKDNTPTPSPLVKFPTELKVHDTWSTGATSGVGSEYLKLVPAVSERAIMTAGKDGTVSATDKFTGKTLWRTNTKIDISGGASANDDLVIVGGHDGDVVALRASDGKEVWRAKVSSEVLAAPALNHEVAVIKSIDGNVTGLSPVDGHVLWHYSQTEPTLILRGASSPKLTDNSVIVGFANGDLAKLNVRDGAMHWHQTVAMPSGSFAIQRMVDVDADPIIANNRIYAATYQGKVAAMDITSGKVFWSHDISSYSGITADHERIYVSDGKSNVWAFDAESGIVDWKQTQLEARNISGPAVIGNYVVVGDEEGYLHWMSKQDGHFVARVQADGSGILASPVVDNNTLYVLSKSGRVKAYTMG